MNLSRASGRTHRRSHESRRERAVGEAIKRSGSSADDDEGEEDEEVPEDIQDLSPADQQNVIKSRAAQKLFLGTALVVVFSDPMVDVMSEIGVRTGVPASTCPSRSVGLERPSCSRRCTTPARRPRRPSPSASRPLEGAACMNNVLPRVHAASFMGIWQYTAGHRLRPVHAPKVR